MSYDLEQMTDDEIIEVIREGNNEAIDFLMNKYRGLVKKETRTMYIIGADAEDLMQEGMIGLFKAVRDYQPDNKASFCTFAKLCIERQIYNAVKASNRKKHSPLNSYVSLYSTILNEDKEISLADTLPASDTKSNPEKMVIDQERVNMLQLGIQERLSDFEKEVLDLYLEGLAYSDIANQLTKDTKSIDNAIQRIRNKIL